MIKSINSIEDRNRRNQIYDFWSTPAYTVVDIQDEYVGKKLKIENHFNLDEHLKLISDLSRLSDLQFEQTMQEIVNQVIEKNSKQLNVIWEDYFIKKYVEKYAPNSVKQLTLHNKNTLLNEQKYLKDKIALRSSVSQKTFSTKHTSMNVKNEKLFSFKVTTTFGYDGTDVKYLSPRSTGTIHSSLWKYSGVDKNYGGEKIFAIPNGGKAGDVDKKGNFRRKAFLDTSSIIIHQRCLGNGEYVGNVI